MIRYEVRDFDGAIEAGIDPEEIDAHDFDRRWYLLRIEDGRVAILVGQDGGEPEDQSLVRDFSWVAKALADAENRGYARALNDASRHCLDYEEEGETAAQSLYEGGFIDGAAAAATILATRVLGLAQEANLVRANEP